MFRSSTAAAPAICRAGILCAAGLLVLPAVGRAQDERPAEFQTFVLPGLTFTPGISIATMWDSNVALAAGARQPASDGLLAIEPFGQLELKSNRTEFAAGYKGYVRRYFDVEGLDSYDQRVFVSLRRAVTPRFSFYVNDGFADVPTTDEVLLNGLPFSRAGSRTNLFAAGIEHRVTKYVDVNARFENTWVRFDEGALPVPGLVLEDGWINAVHGDVRRRLSERLSIGAEYEFRRASVSEAGRTFNFNDVGGLVSYALTEFTRVSAAAGFSTMQDSFAERDRNGPYFRVAVARDTERLDTGASFERSFVPSFGFGGSSDNYELHGYVRMPFTRNRYYVQANGMWRQAHGLTADDLDLDTLMSNATVGMALTRTLRLEAFHIFTRQDSRLTGGEVNRQRVGLQAVLLQPMRIR
jgi:hypothetical protein